jgi:prolyl-tRNA synthetase
MLWRLSRLFLRTLRDDPADAEVPSHKLLVRAGYVRRVAPGVYTWLPLGWQVFSNIETVVRDEMDAMGAQELHFPALLPREPYEATNRWTEYGDTLFRLKDRREGDYLLGPTHEELFALTVKGEVSSYKDLPLVLYQIQTKYRDEARPRSGILRGREFVMKDSYSFDLDDAGLQASYDAHRAAYVRTFDRLGVRHHIVSAVSGAMGGSASEEFLAPTPVGEDTFVLCPSCGYAANVEAIATTHPDLDAPVDPGAHPPIQPLDTPNTPTIETLANHLGIPASATLKNLVVRLRHLDGTTELLAVGVPGDREVDMKRLEALVAPSEVEPVDAEFFAKHPTLVKGYIGPQDMAGVAFRYWADPRVAPGTAWVTGANVRDTHAANVVAGRDFTIERYVDVATVAEGDPCPRCGTGLGVERGIEVGHIFQLGRKYTNAFDLDVQGPDGQPIRVTMGSYGIGVSRLVAVIAEQWHDDAGLVWPDEIAPAHVHVVAAGKEPQAQAADALAAELEAAGMRVLLDDRAGVSAGVKFKDADLLGMPVIVVVGRGLADGVVEVKDRRTGERRDVALDAVVGELAGRFVPGARR